MLKHEISRFVVQQNINNFEKYRENLSDFDEKSKIGIQSRRKATEIPGLTPLLTHFHGYAET